MNDDIKKEETGIKVSSHLKITILDTNTIVYDGRIKDNKDVRITKNKI